MRHASAKAAGQKRLTGGPWWFNNDLISPSGVLPTMALEFATIEGGRYMAGGAPKTFAGAIDFTRDSDGTFFDAATILQTAITDVARFDHDPVTGARRGLLGEEERINIILQSNDFDTTWAVSSGVAMAQTDIGIDGLVSAWKLLDDGGGGTGQLRVSQTITVSASTVYTFSVYANKDQLDWLSLGTISFTAPGNTYSYFNINSGALGAEGTGHSSQIEELSNGFFRCSITFTTDSSDTSGSIRIRAAESDGNVEINRDDSSSVLLYGAQFEIGAFPSSYTPTTGGSATRKADLITLVVDGSLPHPGYNQTENTIAGKLTLTDVTTEQVLVSYNDNTTNNRVELFVVSGSLKARVIVATVAKASITLGSVTSATSFTFALSWIANALRGSVGGASEVNDTASNTIPSVSQCDVFSQLGTTSLVGQGLFDYLYQYPTAFSGATLEALAT